MNEPNSQDHSSASAMRDDSKDAGEREEQPTPADATAASSSLVPSADDARAAQLARRTQLREESECDAAEHERRRLEALTTKAAAREARRAAAVAAQAAQWRSLSPAQRLFTDGVALCLGFLDLKAFNSAGQSCKSWRAGAHAVRSLGQSNLSASVAVLPSLLSSPFRHLVQSFADSDDLAHCYFECRPSRLKVLPALSSLTSLSLRMDLVTFASAAPIQYPPQLATAGLTLGWYDLIGEASFDARSVLRGLISCASLTRLDLEMIDYVPISLTAIGALKQIHHLSIQGFVETHYTPATLHAIKSLPLLETLTLTCTKHRGFSNDEDLEWLAPLLTPPHQLQSLRSFHADGFYLWDNELCTQLLPSLVALTELNSPRASILALPVLAAFTKLEKLHLSFDHHADFTAHEDVDDLDAAYDGHERARLSVLVPHLTHCSLTELAVTRIVCDGESLAALCNTQPQLKALHLYDASLTTVQPLSTLRQLEQLILKQAVYSDPLTHLFEQMCACKSLQRLKLTDIEPDLSETHQYQLAPPSTVLPLLTSFDYSSRDEADVESEDSSTFSPGPASDDSSESSFESS